jgi:hypothetical protein
MLYFWIIAQNFELLLNSFDMERVWILTPHMQFCIQWDILCEYVVELYGVYMQLGVWQLINWWYWG